MLDFVCWILCVRFCVLDFVCWILCVRFCVLDFYVSINLRCMNYKLERYHIVSLTAVAYRRGVLGG